MVYIKDDWNTFTITLTALLEGKGIIAYIEIYNVTQGTVFWWGPDTELWDPSLPEAVEGDSIQIYGDLRNDGDATDTLFAEFVSADVTPEEPTLMEMLNVIVGATPSFGTWSFTMPPNNISITINAGHVE